MSTVYAGSLTLGQCVPMALAAQSQLDAAIGVSLPGLQARLAGALAAQLRLTATPPTLAANLDAAGAIVASITASIAVGMPSIDFQLTALATFVLAIELEIAALMASVSFSASFLALLGSPGIHYYVFEGRAAEFGPNMSAELSAGLPGAPLHNQIAGAVLLAADGGAKTALRTVLRS